MTTLRCDYWPVAGYYSMGKKRNEDIVL